MTASTVVTIDHFSDVLCVWAYCAQIRVDELRANFGDSVAVRYRFIPVFGSTARKIGDGWANRGGFAEYAAHVRSVVARFPHVSVHDDVWERVRPASAAAPHLFLEAVRILESSPTSPRGGVLETAAKAVRAAFFRDARDVALRVVQMEIAEALGLPRAPIEAAMDDGRAHAAACENLEAQTAQKIEGSPTLVFNEGRQKLYGNVGYRFIQANVEELLRVPDAPSASWC
ncbi:MAG: DsbA family protein [Deltaproteobacteria bacterium]|jgi:predicted DsbA family dithiol-disulfide isomerase|nr:DsbA family protein [Deltaproteobacteria bacterium]